METLLEFKKKIVCCKTCSVGDLYWNKTDNGWRLFNSCNDEIHKCIAETSKKIIICKKCGKEGLYWKNTANGYRLINKINGQAHVCSFISKAKASKRNRDKYMDPSYEITKKYLGQKVKLKNGVEGIIAYSGSTYHETVGIWVSSSEYHAIYSDNDIELVIDSENKLAAYYKEQANKYEKDGLF